MAVGKETESKHLLICMIQWIVLKQITFELEEHCSRQGWQNEYYSQGHQIHSYVLQLFPTELNRLKMAVVYFIIFNGKCHSFSSDRRK
jgi:hypothetical protein